MMKATVYQLNFPSGQSYVGVTTQSLRSRFAQHKWQQRFDEEPSSIEPIIVCPKNHGHKMEMAIIAAMKPEKNRSLGGKGPHGMKVSAELREAHRLRGIEKMKDKQWLSKFRAITKDPEAQRLKGRLGAAAKHSKLPKYRFYKGDKFLGIVQHGKDVQAIIGGTSGNGAKYISGKLGVRYGYRVEKVEG